MKKVYILLLALCTINIVNAQWLQTNGPYGGSINFRPLNGSNVFAGAYGAGVWKRSLSEMLEIEENSLHHEFSVHPNPMTDNLTIETNSIQEQRIEIVSLLGQTVYTTSINKKATVNTSAFPSGVYILKLFNDKETVVRIFIKQ
ncbi:MAG: T9SS type A sorting domain-containing protein [Bacteroidales bacterium]